MIDLLKKYAAKLVASGLCNAHEPLFAALDDELVWNRKTDPRQPLLRGVLERLNISALLIARPAGACQAALAELARQALADGTRSITPGDCETRTFLHDLPVLDELSPQAIAAALSHRKGCVILSPGEEGGEVHVAAYGTVSPEQAYVTFSSLCFAGFVAYFANYLQALRTTGVTDAQRAAFARIAALLPPDRADDPQLLPGPFSTEDAARAAIIQAGAKTVEYGLVDSYFGNISYRLPGQTPETDTILISQTGSSLDELAPCIDPCRMDGGTCAGITASSEFSAHKAIYEGEGPPDQGGAQAILHGHPRFSVILSLDCPELDCPDLGQCHRACTRTRCVEDAATCLNVPIVPGEVGTGPFGLCNTLPPAILGTSGPRRAAIVYGHGLFALGAHDFRDAFATLMQVEAFCRQEYFRRVAGLGG